MNLASEIRGLFSCPCCGLRTFEEKPPGTFLVCPACWWEDDPIQFEQSDLTLGANRVSLDEARRNCDQFGISDPSLKRYQRRNQTIRFSFCLEGSWAVANLADSRHGYKMVPTYLSDALGDLIAAVNHVFDVGRAQCSWADEPGEWLWSLERQKDQLHIQILRFRQWHPGKTLDPQSQIWTRDFAGMVFESNCDLRDFAIEVERAAQEVLSQRTIEQYETEWRHSFPQAGLEQLGRRISAVQGVS